MKILEVSAALLVAIMPLAVSAQDARHPVIADYGRITPLPDSANRPEPGAAIRALFDVASGPAAPGDLNPGLEKVARYVNLLGSAGVRASAGDLVVIVHGPATGLVMTDGAYQAKFGTPNPNLGLIEALRRAAVEIHVCGQALTGQKIVRDQVNPHVTVDLSAMTTLARYQASGWALIPD